jgi:hypothetical protein
MLKFFWSMLQDWPLLIVFFLPSSSNLCHLPSLCRYMGLWPAPHTEWHTAGFSLHRRSWRWWLVQFPPWTFSFPSSFLSLSPPPWTGAWWHHGVPPHRCGKISVVLMCFLFPALVPWYYLGGESVEFLLLGLHPLLCQLPQWRLAGQQCHPHVWKPALWQEHQLSAEFTCHSGCHW